MDPKLAAKFREIKTYSGRGIDDPTTKIYLDLTPKGFHGMILSAAGTIFIDPYFREDDNYYVTYYKKNFKPVESVTFSCAVIEDKGKLATEEQDIRDREVQLSSGASRQASIQMTTYRIAIGATRQFTAFHGGTVADGLAAINTTLNRVRAVYEDELAVSFQLVADNDKVVFTTAENDPYTNGNAAIGQNQAVLDEQIGNDNYDIGHVFTTSSGLASLGVVCSGSKARGTTGLGSPTGDPFNIDYVAHEIGHQFGGSHTFNGATNNCSAGNRTASTAYEPGSGSTIQAYAGICGDDDLQDNSDAYFHLVSLNQMRTHVTTGSGGNCGILGATNNTPVANANLEIINGKSIPANTPFELTGSATDPDGDNLTYNWEQWDLGSQSTLDNPGANAPLFRSFEPTSNPTRTFPKLSAILSNTSSLGEQLPTGTRDLNFQFIARDDNAVGGYDAGLISLSVVGGTGPFKINSPNTAGTFSGSTDITWDVAGTTANPINCGQVDIYLSTDGGQTFGQLLVDDTPNDGSVNVAFPEIHITTARLKIKCADNVFFDINDANFTIQPSPSNNCAITDITAGTTSTCNGMNNYYTQQVTVTYNEDAPPTGNLIVNGQSFPLTSSPQTVTLTALDADGNAVNVTASFSDNISCSFTKNNVFTAPAPCAASVCRTYNSTDTPITISTSGTPTISSDLTIKQAGKITSVKVNNLVGDHTYVGDLTVTLTSPAGTTITLFSRVCSFQNNFNLNFDDAGSADNIACPPTDGVTYKPSTGTFASFNDQDASGTWTLTIADAFNDDGGSLTSWSLEICTENEISSSIVAFNNTSSNGLESVSSANLQVDLSAASASSVMVDYSVTGTATGNGTDYTLANGTLTFNAGSTSENITIANIIDDLLDETNETVIVTLSNPVNATLGTNTIHTYTITDNDDDPTNCSLSSIELNQNPIPANTYISGGTITSTGTVATNTSINFQAKTSITLGVGFQAVAGSTFLAKIADCTPSFQETPASALRNLNNTPLKAQPPITAVKIYPNPFAYTTTIAYQLSETTDLTIRLFDLSGKEVQRLLIGDKNTSGHHQLQLNASHLPKGMYLLHFQTKETVITKKLVVQQ